MSSTIPLTTRAPTPEDRPYPIRVHARPDGPLSRWLWLVKWLLIVPHALMLVPLWIGFWLLSLVALVAIVVTGRYPRSIFEFNVGVLRWSWRVGYYAYCALGTDRYPPFTLAEVPGYPARLDVEYPARLHRGLVLVKWVLAVPHIPILGILFGGGLSWWAGGQAWVWGGGGVVGVLVLVAGILLAAAGQYPRPLFDVILGMNRWALRVAGYAALMTDRYPPFRLDLGGDDPGGPAAPSGEPAVRSDPGRL
ncbi:DUF4389 domain-containing protein [Nonomuraea sp. K274]|uniref:DUF4389 domain-containing protein n=1 Tax=Nonomuraea cypriaca TaxID=1187855 RepID=A0A931F0Z6_9ACTN|nr:DUF4389 domain-containing protein [Nonomuraea cypriaca]MBF8191374.1 DUF4389 domain-containing protein [Nonomuraea cypriaca]